ncbi:MAG: hypothetical protein ACOYNS_16245 [Bacteroidota bacterium]
MSTNVKILTGIYTLVCSVTVLVMLTTSFELFNEKYFPSFMLAQKYALPLAVSAMAVVFLTFFEPERLSQRGTVVIMRFVMALTLLIFTYYLTTLDSSVNSAGTLIVFGAQWLATLVETFYFLQIKFPDQPK